MNDLDPLTGVLNCSAFHQRLAEAVDKALATSRGFALLYIDIDNFKHFNLHNGHLVGDEVLKNFVTLVQPLLRTEDSLFRFGGDEFVVILPKAGREESLNVSRQICHLVREKASPPQPAHCGDKHCMGPAMLTVSVGVELFEKDMDAEKIVRLAEQKMYDAKCGGRDRVCM